MQTDCYIHGEQKTFIMLIIIVMFACWEHYNSWEFGSNTMPIRLHNGRGNIAGVLHGRALKNGVPSAH